MVINKELKKIINRALLEEFQYIYPALTDFGELGNSEELFNADVVLFWKNLRNAEVTFDED